MLIKGNPRLDELLADLRNSAMDLLLPWEGDCWRYQSITHPYSHHILNGEGALVHGGRWNAPRAFPVVYGSTSEVVALKESNANNHYYGLSCRKPRLFVCIGMKLTRVLDITDRRTLKKLNLVSRHLKAEDWRKINAEGHESLTQCLGRATHLIGAEGILAPSSCINRGVNVACFPNNINSSSMVFLHEEKEINKMLKGRNR